MKANVLLFSMCMMLLASCGQVDHETKAPEEFICATPGEAPAELSPTSDEPTAEEPTPEFPTLVWEDYDPPRAENLPELDREGYETHIGTGDDAWTDLKCPFEAKTGKVDEVIGAWKQVKEINGNEIIDRSCEDLVYRFAADRTLTISNGTEGTEEVIRYGYRSFPLCATCLPQHPQPNLWIGDSTVYCQIFFETMVVFPKVRLTDTGRKLPDDGVRILFVRID